MAKPLELGEVMKIKRALEELSGSETRSKDEMMDRLKCLERCRVTLDLLQKSGIGITVNRIRKTINEPEVSSLVKKLLKSWKKFLPGTAAGHVSEPTTPDMISHNRSTKQQRSRPGTTSHRPAIRPYVATAPPLPSSAPSPLHSSTSELLVNSSSRLNNSNEVVKGSPVVEGSPVAGFSGTLLFPESISGSECTLSTGCGLRDRCRELLVKALKRDCREVTTEEEYKFYNLSSQIEESVFVSFGDTGNKYKQKVRSRVSNLGDAKNLSLRQQVITGGITPEEIASMTAEEMASDSMKMLRQKLTEEAIRDAQVAHTDGAGGTNCDLLRCPECGKNKCSYTQAQTLASDEPMTTFAYCNDCGNRWIFY